MEFRSIFIANPAQLSARREQLVIRQSQRLPDQCSPELRLRNLTGSSMRILVFFDLHVKTKAQRSAATKFRNFLLTDGYHMVQLSVYARICSGTDSVAVHKLRLAKAVPPRGSVRMLVITEKQYSNIEILLGKPTEYDAPQQMEQLMLF